MWGWMFSAAAFRFRESACAYSGAQGSEQTAHVGGSFKQEALILEKHSR